MLKPQDIEIEIGRANTAGNDFMKVTHKPTGIVRREGPPLPNSAKAKQRMLKEIEAELIERGLTQYLLRKPAVDCLTHT